MPWDKTVKARYLGAATVACLAAKLYFSVVSWTHAGVFALTITLALSSLALLLAQNRFFSMAKLWPQTAIAGMYASATAVLLHIGLLAGGWATLRAAAEFSWLVPLVIYVFLTAVLEEIVFRKYFLEFLSSRLPLFAAISISALVFFLCHMTLIPAPLLTGLLFGYWAQKYRSIWLSVVIHFMHDLTFYVGNQFAGARSALASGVTINTVFSAAAVGAILLTILVVLFQQIYRLACCRMSRA